MNLKRLLVLNITIIILSLSCARAPLENRVDALRPMDKIPEISDDLDIASLIAGIKKNITNLKKRDEYNLYFGEKIISSKNYASSLQLLLDLYEKKGGGKEQFIKLIKEYFDFYEVYGRDDYGEILLTSYYAPMIEGSLERKDKMIRPLYRTPDDIVEIDFDDFNSEDLNLEIKNPRRVFARITKEKSVRGNYRIVPYYTRKEIDFEEGLKGKDLELCYVDPLDSFFFQIQGSGFVKLTNGEIIRLGYDGQNGHRYQSIGKFLKDIIPPEEMTLHKLETYLRSMPENEMLEFLNQNPSYVFFRKLDGPPITYWGNEVINGRTLATDAKFFPKGTLALLQFEKPNFANAKEVVPKDFTKTVRFVFDQDTGGAIKGGGRADLFWGVGKIAKQHAGVINQIAKLYYLAPKDELLMKLSR